MAHVVEQRRLYPTARRQRAGGARGEAEAHSVGYVRHMDRNCEAKVPLQVWCEHAAIRPRLVVYVAPHITAVRRWAAAYKVCIVASNDAYAANADEGRNCGVHVSFTAGLRPQLD